MNPDKQLTHFYVLTLKSNSWKFIGDVKYQNTGSNTAALLDGALYWFMSNKKETVIISLDLCRDELKEIPQPDHTLYLNERTKYNKLVIIQGCLCIYYYPSAIGTYHHQVYPVKTRVMTKNKSWQVFQCDDDSEMKYDAVHCLRMPGDAFLHDNGRHGIYLSKTLQYVHAPIFVPSLVSPHVNNNTNERPMKTKNNGRLGQEKINNNKRAKKNSTYFVMSRSFPFSLKRTRKRQPKKRNAKVQIAVLKLSCCKEVK